MNIFSLRGFAVLALLCLLPRATALTITYTHTETATVSGSHSSEYAHTSFRLPTFDTSLGSLKSVIFSAEIDVSASMHDNAVWGPTSYTPYLNYQIQFFATSLGFPVELMALYPSPEFQANGPTVQLAQYQGVNFAHVFPTLNISQTVTNPNVLPQFSDPNAINNVFATARFQSSQWYGSTTGNLTTDFTVTYVYDVDENGSAAALLMGGLLMLFTLRRMQMRGSLFGA